METKEFVVGSKNDADCDSSIRSKGCGVVMTSGGACNKSYYFDDTNASEYDTLKGMWSGYCTAFNCNNLGFYDTPSTNPCNSKSRTPNE